MQDPFQQKALKQIDESNYIDKLTKLAIEKYQSLKGEQYLIRKKKTIDYLVGRGFELDLINFVISELSPTQN